MWVVERYCDEREGCVLIGLSNIWFNIFWVNMEILKGALLVCMVELDVCCRFPDPNFVVCEVVILLERVLFYGLDVYDGIMFMKVVLEDYFLLGCGVVWVVYEFVIIKEKIKIEVDGEDVVFDEIEEIECLGD